MFTIRPWRAGDAEALNQAVAESREHLLPWMPWASDPPMSLAGRRAWIADGERSARAGENENLGIFADARIAGACGLHRRIGPGALEIGYWVHPAFLRRGAATHAVRALCARAFAQPSIGHVEIRHDPDNVASAGVAAAAGFEDTGLGPGGPGAAGAAGGATGRPLTRVWRLDRGAWERTLRIASAP